MRPTDKGQLATRARPRPLVIGLLLALAAATVARLAGRLDPVLFYGVAGGLLMSLGVIALDRLHTLRLRATDEEGGDTSGRGGRGQP